MQNIKVVDPLPAQAVFVTASNGGVYDPATHSVTWSYDKWAYQNPLTSTVTVKYPEGSVTTADMVTNTATITAEGMNEPTNVVSKSSEITHGFADRRVEATAEKIGTYNRDYARGDELPWRFEGSNNGNTTVHYRWEDVMPCTWSSEDGKAAGDGCDKPAFVGPYEFKISTKSGYEDISGWTFEYWTNKGNHETVTYKNTRTLTLPDGEWITRFVIETDVAPLARPTVDLISKVSRDVPRTEPADLRATTTQSCLRRSTTTPWPPRTMSVSRTARPSRQRIRTRVPSPSRRTIRVAGPVSAPRCPACRSARNCAPTPSLSVSPPAS